MVLLELPVSFKDLKTMMEIFKAENQDIDNYVVEASGNMLLVNPTNNGGEKERKEK